MSTVNSTKHSASMPSTDSSAGSQLTSASVDNYIGAFISQAADVALCLAKYTQLPSEVLIKEEQDEQPAEIGGSHKADTGGQGRKKQLKTQLSVLKVSRSNLELELERTKLSLAEIEKKRAELKSRRDEIARVLKLGELWEKKIAEEIALCPNDDNEDFSDDETVDNYSTVGADDSGYEFSDSLHELRVLESLLSNKPLPQTEPSLTSNSAKVVKSFEPKPAEKRKVLPGKSKKAIETNNRQRSLTSNTRKNHKKKTKEKKVILKEDTRKEEKEIIQEPDVSFTGFDMDSMHTDDSSVGPLEVKPKRKYQKRKGVDPPPPTSVRHRPRRLRVPNPELKSFLCPTCGKGFAQLDLLQAHQRLHSDKFKCAVCDKRFQSAARLEEHMRVHTGEMKFSCDKCGRGFTCRRLLKLHMLIHSDDRPYQCSQCPATFRRAHILHSHVLRVHERERLHACSICDKKYAFPRLLRDHMISHTGIRAHTCSMCGKSFMTAPTLRIHERRMHGAPHPPGYVKPEYIFKKSDRVNAASENSESMPLPHSPGSQASMDRTAGMIEVEKNDQ